ncbi:hypothetical protein GKJPGBOP_02235 [Streptomyces paromomycinus]|uniref:Uncharacterized protein n=1 Tax=Streptomyces paromomycinus TaxID=92743 RepID=A0A401VZW8_STREY|nr:hypothetical protein GKJPGBOP_02235 [Streptomyces paromomycinus]
MPVPLPGPGPLDIADAVVVATVPVASKAAAQPRTRTPGAADHPRRVRVKIMRRTLPPTACTAHCGQPPRRRGVSPPEAGLPVTGRAERRAAGRRTSQAVPTDAGRGPGAGDRGPGARDQAEAHPEALHRACRERDRRGRDRRAERTNCTVTGPQRVATRTRGMTARPAGVRPPDRRPTGSSRGPPHPTTPAVPLPLPHTYGLTPAATTAPRSHTCTEPRLLALRPHRAVTPPSRTSARPRPHLHAPPHRITPPPSRTPPDHITTRPRPHRLTSPPDHASGKWYSISSGSSPSSSSARRTTRRARPSG